MIVLKNLKMNNRKKMYLSNTKIRKHLINLGFTNLYFFPHLRFSKGFNLEKQEFDGLGFKKDDKRIYLIQLKTNKKISKKTLKIYKSLEKKYNIKVIWATKLKRKGVEVYNL
jgi:hypothetical protein